ncbi:MAG: META domain-containing protein [Gammaproteobacteria bacterium]|nr:META domain-containing protein [Gammaproteobacteria bacterium]
MKSTIAFMFFMLFLAGIAFVSLRGMQDTEDALVTTASQLADVAWRPTHLGEMTIDEETEMRIQFEVTGQFGGHGGCNRFFGSYELTDEALVIGPIGATRMACPEPSMSMEMSYFEALNGTKSAHRIGNRLAVKNDSGENLVRFVATDRDQPDQ